MANQTINKVQINGNPETYDVEDAQARQGILDLTQKTNQLKEDIVNQKKEIDNSRKVINELNDKKITKFYASNIGETTLNDSDNGKIQDMMIYGKSSQDGTPTPDNPIEIQSVVNPIVELAGIVRDGTDSNLLSEFQLKWLVANYDKWHDDEHIVLFSKQWNRLFVFNPNVYDDESEIYYYGYIIYPNEIKIDNGRFNQHMYQITYYPYVYLYSAKEFRFKRSEAKYLISSIADSYETVGIGSEIASLPYTLNAIPVSKGGNVTIDGQKYIADYVDIERNKLVRMVDKSKLNTTVSIIDNTDLLLETPTITDLTDEEVQAFKSLTTFYPVTNISANSEQLDGYTVFNYPISMANGWNYVKQQLNDNRDYIYDMDLQSAEAYVNSEYAVTLTELEV